MKALVCLAASFGLLLSSSQAQNQKQSAPAPSQLAVLGVTIDKDDFTSLKAKLGEVRKCQTGDHVSIAGYRLRDQQVVFEFSEVGGGRVTAFRLRSPSTSTNCPDSKLSSKISSISTEGGIRLGMGEDEFSRVFGAPHSKSEKGSWEYSWTWEEPLTEKVKKQASTVFPGANVSNAEVSIIVRATFTGHILRNFYISKLEVL